MGWSHPSISLKELLRLIKGFIDILILAAGCRSSGLPASWDAENIKKAIRWGSFFENLFSHLSKSTDYDVSVKELDAALLEMTSSSSFPQGLRHLSSAALSRASYLVIEFFSQNLSLSTGHLNALLRAVIEMDFNDLAISDAVGIEVYVKKLTEQVKSLDVISTNELPLKNSSTKSDISNATGLSVSSSFPHANPSEIETEHRSVTIHGSFVIQELPKRQASVSCLSTCEASLDLLLGLVVRNNSLGIESETSQEQACGATPQGEEKD